MMEDREGSSLSNQIVLGSFESRDAAEKMAEWFLEGIDQHQNIGCFFTLNECRAMDIFLFLMELTILLLVRGSEATLFMLEDLRSPVVIALIGALKRFGYELKIERVPPEEVDSKDEVQVFLSEMTSAGWSVIPVEMSETSRPNISQAINRVIEKVCVIIIPDDGEYRKIPGYRSYNVGDHYIVYGGACVEGLSLKNYRGVFQGASDLFFFSFDYAIPKTSSLQPMRLF